MCGHVVLTAVLTAISSLQSKKTRHFEVTRVAAVCIHMLQSDPIGEKHVPVPSKSVSKEGESCIYML